MKVSELITLLQSEDPDAKVQMGADFDSRFYDIALVAGNVYIVNHNVVAAPDSGAANAAPSGSFPCVTLRP